MKTFGQGMLVGSALIAIMGMDISIVLFCALIGIAFVLFGSSNGSNNVN
jgi:hypothetical protein